MNVKRRFMLTFMAIIMFTPSLVCAQTMICAKMQQSPAQQEMPCHGQQDHGQQGDDTDTTGDAGLMMLKDCMGIDLHQAKGTDTALDMIPDGKDIMPVFVLAETSTIHEGITTHTARAPPPAPERLLSSYPSPYLATQRLRI